MEQTSQEHLQEKEKKGLVGRASDFSIEQYYETYFKNSNDLIALDHVPDEILAEMMPGSIIVVEENQMGISFSAIAVLFDHCKVILDKIDSSKLTPDQYQQSEMASKIMLCINGESSKNVHIRMELLKLGYLNVNDERHFNEVICLKFKKSGILWFYRLQILDEILLLLLSREPKSDSTSIASVAESILKEEQVVMNRMLEKHPRNYHAWTYRMRLIKSWFERKSIESIEFEFTWVQEYIYQNIHEYSAFNHLYLLLRLTNFEKVDAVLAWANGLKVTYEAYDFDENPLSEIKYGKLGSLTNFIKSITKKISIA